MVGLMVVSLLLNILFGRVLNIIFVLLLGVSCSKEFWWNCVMICCFWLGINIIIGCSGSDVV